MSDLILMHGENGKTFFVDKEDYIKHWEWKRPTKYVDKYKNDSGKWVYVYDRGPSGLFGNKRDLYYDTANHDDSIYDTSWLNRKTAYIDKYDNTKFTNEMPTAKERPVVDTLRSVFGLKNSPIYIDSTTGKRMSSLRVNGDALLNRIRIASTKKIGELYIKNYAKKHNKSIEKNQADLKKSNPDEFNNLLINSDDIQRYQKYFNKFGENGYSYEDIIEHIEKDMLKRTGDKKQITFWNNVLEAMR